MPYPYAACVDRYSVQISPTRAHPTHTSSDGVDEHIRIPEAFLVQHVQPVQHVLKQLVILCMGFNLPESINESITIRPLLTEQWIINLENDTCSSKSSLLSPERHTQSLFKMVQSRAIMQLPSNAGMNVRHTPDSRGAGGGNQLVGV